MIERQNFISPQTFCINIINSQNCSQNKDNNKCNSVPFHLVILQWTFVIPPQWMCEDAEFFLLANEIAHAPLSPAGAAVRDVFHIFDECISIGLIGETKCCQFVICNDVLALVGL